jgi:hypothetical protein
VRNISASGALLMAQPLVVASGSIVVVLDDIGPVPARIARQTDDGLGVCFEGISGDERDRLIQSIYAEGRSNAVRDVKPLQVMAGLLQTFMKP